MRLLSAFIVLVFLASCGNTKDTTGTDGSSSSNDSNGKSVEESPNMDAAPAITAYGVIVDKSAEDGCGFMIKVQMDEIEKILDPGSLPDEYKKDGIEVAVTFTFSRMQSKCPGTQPVIIEEIKKK